MGRGLLLVAAGFAAYAGVAAPASARRGPGGWTVARPELLASARRALIAAAAAVTLSAALLVYALATRDFSIAYVAQSTSRATQPWYTISALWSGMAGSLLLWCLILSMYGAAFVRREREPFTPFAVPVLSAALLFFLVITAGPENPFRRLDIVPLDGRGLNPLLQSPGMVVHPPLLYTGLIGLLVPFAIAVSALWSGRCDAAWIRVVRRWTLVPWLTLGCGMVVGGAWAYTELGWGGYWGWDPVENAAFLPWLAATAFLHSAVVQERRGMLRIWNVFLITAAADLAVFGTFLTRSGLLSSVHTFAESPIGRWFFVFLAAQTTLGIGLIAWRLPSLRSEHHLDSPLSRESGFLVNNLVFCGAALVVLWGTVLPLWSEALWGRRLGVGPPFFNRFLAPIGAVLLALAAVGPVLPWRRGTAGGVARRLALPACVAASAGVVALVVTRNGAFAGLAALATLTGSVGLRELTAASRARRRVTGESPARAAGRTVTGNPRRYGGYIVHLGVAVMVVGFAGSLFRDRAEVVASPGERFRFAGYTFAYRDLERFRAPDKQVHLATLDVYRGERRLAVLRPQLNIHESFEQPQSEIGIRTTLREDLYVILAGTDDDSDDVVFRLHRNPLVAWVWIGTAVAAGGGLVSLAAGRRRRRRVAPVPSPAPEREAAWKR